MADWIGPTVAISVALIAIGVIVLAAVLLAALKDAHTRAEQVTKELHDLRVEMAPALEAINSLGESGAEIAEIAKHEVKELATTSAIFRRDIKSGLKKSRKRLADFDALIEVLNEEVEDAALDLAVAVRTVRTTKGVIGGVRRFLIPRRRSED